MATTRNQLGELITGDELKQIARKCGGVATAMLRKPPFAFLHALVCAVTEKTGFAEGLFKPDEQRRALKGDDPKAQEAWISKLVEAIESEINEKLELHPDKVICGMEAEQTNLFLQALARAADPESAERGSMERQKTLRSIQSCTVRASTHDRSSDTSVRATERDTLQSSRGSADDDSVSFGELVRRNSQAEAAPATKWPSGRNLLRAVGGLGSWSSRAKAAASRGACVTVSPPTSPPSSPPEAPTSGTADTVLVREIVEEEVTTTTTTTTRRRVSREACAAGSPAMAPTPPTTTKQETSRKLRRMRWMSGQIAQEMGAETKLPQGADDIDIGPVKTKEADLQEPEPTDLDNLDAGLPTPAARPSRRESRRLRWLDGEASEGPTGTSQRLSRAPSRMSRGVSYVARASVARGQSFKVGVQATSKRTVEHTRDRHTLVSGVFPLDPDIEDPAHLRDEQTTQIFFHTLMWELAMCCVWVNAVTITAGGQLDVRNMMIVGFSTAVTQVILVLFTRFVFRRGNLRLHEAWIAYGDNMPLSERLIFAGHWGFNVLTMIGMCWIVIAYGFCFGNVQTRDVFYGWGYGLGVSWLVTEPLVILMLATLPSLCKKGDKQESCVGKCFDRMDEMGLNAEIFFG